MLTITNSFSKLYCCWLPLAVSTLKWNLVNLIEHVHCSISTEGVADRMKVLLSRDPKLIRAFNQFLP